jgi:peptidoglycan/xylan/chitin deacetylase (PgdA/CDA1 family)
MPAMSEIGRGHHTKPFRASRTSLAARVLGAVAMLVALAASAHLAGFPEPPGWRGPRPVDRSVPTIPILMYHHIGDWGEPHPSWVDWVVRPKDFAAQLDWLLASGYRTVTFAEVLWAQEHGGTLPAKPIILSFDDGWGEHAHWLATELSPRGLRGVLFVFTGAVAPNRNNGGYISWEELLALQADGHEIESHTVSHARLPKLRDEALAQEMSGSRDRIREMLGREAAVLAYPYGDLDPRVAAAAARAGYRLAVRADADPALGGAARLSLPRLRMCYGEGTEVLEARLREGYAEHSRY